jgi:hypothetical protein
MGSKPARYVLCLLVASCVVGVFAGAAAGRARYCSPTGDLCYGAFGKGAKVRLRITLMAGYFTHYRLCVTGPDRKTDCRRFAMHKASHGLYDSNVAWSRHFPFRGAGTYHARWYWGSGPGTRIEFAEGPSIRVTPQRVTAGHRVRVFGLAGGCPNGDAVTLLSKAFPAKHEFAGIPAVYAKVDSQDSYSTHTVIPAHRKPGKYVVTARCGGGNFGVQAIFRVLKP